MGYASPIAMALGHLFFAMLWTQATFLKTTKTLKKSMRLMLT